MARRSGSKKRFQWLNPETVLYLAYVLYVSSDKTSEGTMRYDQACALYRKISEVDASLDTPDGQFLTQVTSVIISYAGGIRRLREILNDELRSAHEEYRDQKNQIARTRFMSSGIAAAKKAGLLLAISGLGYSLAQTFSIFIPTHVAEKSGMWAPSLAAAILLPLIGSWVAMMWRDFRLSYIEKRYSKRIIEAWNLFLKKRLSEYEKHKFDLCEMYKSYTGKRYANLNSMEAALKDDIEAYKDFVGWRDSMASNPLHMIIPFLRRASAWRKKKNGEDVVPLNPSTFAPSTQTTH